MAEENLKEIENEEIENEEEIEEEDDQKKTGDDNQNKSGDDESQKKNEKTFTQSQVNSMMTREKKQGRNSMLRELGIDPKDTKQVAMIKAFIDSQKTDEEKEAEKQQNAFEKEKELAIANAKVEIMKQGVKSQYVDDAVSLVMAQLNDDNDVATVLASFKVKYPVWFENTGEDDDKKDEKNKSVGKKGTGSSVKGNSKGNGSKDNNNLGARLAAQRKGKSKKESYWK